MRRQLAGWFACLALAAGCGDEAATPEGPAAGIVAGITPVATSGFRAPLDSTPDASGRVIYFTATNDAGRGVFRVEAQAGAVTPVHVGAPFVEPAGLALGGDDARVFVADARAGGRGSVLVLPAGGGAPAALAGTENTAPRGLDVVTQGDREVVYFTGRDPGDGTPAVFSVPAQGGAATVIARGAPLVEPDGVAVRGDGAVFVSDRAAAGGGFGAVFQIAAGGRVTPVVERVRTGNPAGIALTLDGSLLLVSALQPDRDSDQVLLVDLETRRATSVTAGIAQNRAAGGVHRARRAHVFSWADLTAGLSGLGTVYRVPVTRTFRGGRCTCSYTSEDACRSAGGTAEFCTACC